MNMKDLINRISYFRVKKNLSARELSLQIGKAGGYINKLESYDFNLPVPVLLDILEALEVSAEEFFYLGQDYNKDTKELLHKFNKLSDANKQTIIDLVNKLQN